MATGSIRLSALRTEGKELKQHAQKADANGNGVVTQSEVRKYGAAQNDGFVVGNALLTMHSWAMRDFDRGGSVTVKHLQGTVDSALKAISNKDLNGNDVLDAGPELTAAKRLKTFQGLSAMADRKAPTLETAKLRTEIAKYAGKAIYMSEGDYNPRFVSVPFATTPTLKNLVSALQTHLSAFYKQEGQPIDPAQYTGESYSPNEAKAFIDGLSAVGPDDDTLMRNSAQAFGKITDLMKANLKDLKVFKYGPKDEDGGLATDQGLYVQVVVGKAKDGKLAGILLGDVET